MQHELATLVGSRICHDLISPLGAISNGVELMGMTQSKDGAEMALINDSVLNANARIKFFRVAFGDARADQFMGAADVRSILTANARGSRMTYHWRTEDKQRRTHVRVAFLVVQCFESALPRGGEIDVSVTDDTWTLTASGPQQRWEADLWDALTNEFATVQHTAAMVQFALLPKAMATAGLTMELDRTEDRIVVTLR